MIKGYLKPLPGEKEKLFRNVKKRKPDPFKTQLEKLKIERTEKACSICKEVKSIDMFHNNATGSPDGKQYYCKPCGRAKEKERRQRKKVGEHFERKRGKWS